jgi:hypothetical protein
LVAQPFPSPPTPDHTFGENRGSSQFWGRRAITSRSSNARCPKCFCPKELGGACYFEPVGDWMPTHEQFPRPKRDGGHRDIDNAILAHRLCNRIDYSMSVGRPHARDLERVRKPARKRSAATTKDRRSPADCYAAAPRAAPAAFGGSAPTLAVFAGPSRRRGRPRSAKRTFGAAPSSEDAAALNPSSAPSL